MRYLLSLVLLCFALSFSNASSVNPSTTKSAQPKSVKSGRLAKKAERLKSKVQKRVQKKKVQLQPQASDTTLIILIIVIAALLIGVSAILKAGLLVLLILLILALLGIGAVSL